MPYIKREERKRFERPIVLVKKVKLTVGDLNYFITKVLDIYLEQNGEKYVHYNDVIGMLECCKLEYYRKKVSKYEDKKIEENGDV